MMPIMLSVVAYLILHGPIYELVTLQHTLSIYRIIKASYSVLFMVVIPFVFTIPPPQKRALFKAETISFAGDLH